MTVSAGGWPSSCNALCPVGRAVVAAHALTSFHSLRLWHSSPLESPLNAHHTSVPSLIERDQARPANSALLPARFSAAFALLLAIGLTSLLGCENEGASTTTNASCTSGQQWNGGTSGSDLMTPGQDCIACHTAQGEGPQYGIAGTLFDKIDEANDCMGPAGAEVVLTGKDGKEFILKSNSAGNFFLDKAQSAALKLPYKVKVRRGDKVREMISAQSAGSCNSCHTKAGANGAPGRVWAP